MASSGAGSGMIDEDTARTVQSGRETLGALLRTIQKQLQKVFVVFAVGLMGGIMAMRRYVWPQLKADLLARGASVIAQTPFDVILLQVKIGLVVGVLCSLPVLLYYARDPLRERGLIRNVPISRWKAVVVACTGLALFFGGMLYAYYLFFPIMFRFLANNATGAGFVPRYSIVAWTQFILVLGLSFGLAAQLPLAMTALSYSGVVPYETFRDNWKYAIVIMFAFGAMFSPPDPFTQIMWAAPLVMLYGLSLYLSKVVVTAKRGREDIDVAGTLRARWNRIAGTAVLAGGAVYFAVRAGAGVYINDLLRRVPPRLRPGLLRTVESIFGVPRPVALAVTGALAALLVVVVLLLYYVYRSIEGTAAAQAARDAGGAPGSIDLAALDAEGVRAAPPEAFAGLSEEDAVEQARAAMDADRPEKARAILDRFDEAEVEAAEAAENEAAEGDADGDPDPGRTLTSTTAGMVDAFTEDETTEDDIGGYFYDVQFIFGTLRSRLFRVAAVFFVTIAATFGWLYSGGIGVIRDDLTTDIFSNLPPGLQDQTVLDIVTLHPVEALVFEVKLSAVIGAIVTFPVALYYVWPALRERGFVRGERRTLVVWGAAIILGLAVGIAVGYNYIAPYIVSWLVYDAVREGMVISYRVNNFFWLVFLTTAGIGLLADIPITMLLFHYGDLISYRTMRRRWRGVAIAAFAFAGLVTPDSVYTLFLIGIPIVLFYWLGLSLLWLFTLGGRRGRRPPEVADATSD